MQLTGIHHLTAVSASIRQNHQFYTQVLGMRLVKRSVNQDDVTAYHLFYADGVGTPGTDMTFFDWAVRREQRGTHAIVRTGLRVRGESSLTWWSERLRELGVLHDELVMRDGRATLDFEDPEGQRLSLVDDGGTGDQSVPWTESPVPPEHRIRGLGPIVMSVPDVKPTDKLLTRALGFRKVRSYDWKQLKGANATSGAELKDEKADLVHVYEMGDGGCGAELHVAVQPHLPVTHGGAGGVHHVAFRTPNEGEYQQWIEQLSGAGIPHSGPVDRFWFKSLYFREPNGVLFEIATDGPGFSIDENAATLGQHVVLPPFLEPRREAILAGLKQID